MRRICPYKLHRQPDETRFERAVSKQNQVVDDQSVVVLFSAVQPAKIAGDTSVRGT